MAAFDLEWRHGQEKLQAALNARLPGDMAVSETRLAADDFHPRFDAASRRYRYRLFCAAVRDPLRERYAWRVWPAVTDLAELASIWTGKHDFGLFGSPMSPGGNTEREVFFSEWQQCGDEWTFEIEANAFLYRMVRKLVYVQVAAGQKKLSAKLLQRGLDARASVREKVRAEIPASLAPACGLTLVRVRYDDLV